MSFFRVAFLLMLLAKPVLHTIRPGDSIYCDDLVSVGTNRGMAAMEKIVNPLSLLYLDTAYAGTVSDIEFRSGFLRSHPDSLGMYVLNVPEFTISIASSTGNRHAASNLFRYYCSVPKDGGNDTVIRMYRQLYKILPVFVARKPYREILEKRLLSDFNYWYRLSLSSPAVNYADPSLVYDRFLSLKHLERKPDPRLITLQLGLAIQQLNPALVNEAKIKELRALQTSLNNKRFILPLLGGDPDYYSSQIETRTLHTTKSFACLKDLLDDRDEMNLLIANWLKTQNWGEQPDFSHGGYLVKGREMAYLEIYCEFGMQALRLKLLESSEIRVEKLMEAID